MIIVLYTCGQLDKVRPACSRSSSSSSSHLVAVDAWHEHCAVHVRPAGQGTTRLQQEQQQQQQRQQQQQPFSSS
jgi:hypothetical protein